MMKSRALMRKRQGKLPEGTDRQRIPDNSEPWLPGGVRCFADAIWISDQIDLDIKRWKIPTPPIS
jgi:hypothetical protein